MPINIKRHNLLKFPLGVLFLATIVFSGCVRPVMPQRWSSMDPTDPTASSRDELSFRPALIAETKRYIDPSVGNEVTQMNHDMSGMNSGDGMQGMDHSKIAATKSDDDMSGMDHDEMPGRMQKDVPTATSSEPVSVTTMVNEMKKTENEMKKMSDELKSKSNTMKQSQ